MHGDGILRIATVESRLLSWSLLCAFGLALCGCGRSRLPTVRVEGKVTWQGKPLTDGTVQFQPVKLAEGMPQRPGLAELGPDGVYHVSSFAPGDGLLPGDYQVTVYSYTSRPSQEHIERPYVWRIPQRYGDASRSGLKFTVPPDAKGPLTYDIEIEN